MTALYLPGAVWRPVSYRADAGPFTTPPLGYIPHVPVSNGSLFAYFNGLKSPYRKFSTGLIFKNGTSEQYTELTMKPWAQAAGNGQYWAFECEGYPNEPYTPGQINTLALWHNFLGTADRLAETPGATGIGTHYMGGTAWGGHSCPDPQAGVGPRSKQRLAIIARAIALRTPEVDMPLTQAEAEHIAAEVWRYDQAGATPQAWGFLQKAAVPPAPPIDVNALAAAIVAAGGVGVTAAAIAKAVNDDAAKRLLS